MVFNDMITQIGYFVESSLGMETDDEGQLKTSMIVKLKRRKTQLK